VFQPVAGRYEVNAAAGTLRIMDVARSDEGNYACIVNTTGHPVVVSGNAHLYVESMCPHVFYLLSKVLQCNFARLLQHLKTWNCSSQLFMYIFNFKHVWRRLFKTCIRLH